MPTSSAVKMTEAVVGPKYQQKSFIKSYGLEEKLYGTVLYILKFYEYKITNKPILTEKQY